MGTPTVVLPAPLPHLIFSPSSPQYLGRHLRVDVAGPVRRAEGDAPAVEYDRLLSVFVGNLPFDVKVTQRRCPDLHQSRTQDGAPRSSATHVDVGILVCPALEVLFGHVWSCSAVKAGPLIFCQSGLCAYSFHCTRTCAHAPIVYCPAHPVLPRLLQDEEVIAAFSGAGAPGELQGALEAVRVVRDKATGLGKGIAYVMFKSRVRHPIASGSCFANMCSETRIAIKGMQFQGCTAVGFFDRIGM